MQAWNILTLFFDKKDSFYAITGVIMVGCTFMFWFLLMKAVKKLALLELRLEEEKLRTEKLKEGLDERVYREGCFKVIFLEIKDHLRLTNSVNCKKLMVFNLNWARALYVFVKVIEFRT